MPARSRATPTAARAASSAASACLRAVMSLHESNDLGRLPLLVAHEVLLVIDPTIGAILAAEAVFDRLLALLEQIADLGLDAREVVGMHAHTPEIRIVEILAGQIAEQAPDVVADEGRREIVLSLEAVDHGRGSAEQARKLYLYRGLGEMLVLYFFLLARCFGQDTLYDVGLFSGLGTGFQHFSKRSSSNLCVFSWGGHGGSNLWEEADERN